MTQGPSNENTTKWQRPDPDAPYVAEYLAKAIAHFADSKIDLGTVARMMTDALIKLTPGKPYDKLPDEAEIETGLSYLVPAAHHLETRVKAHYKAKARLQNHRLEKLAERHGCDLEQAYRIWYAARTDPGILETGILPAVE